LLLIVLPHVAVGQQRIGGRPGQDMQTQQSSDQKVVKPKVIGWNLSGIGAFVDSVSIDTSLNYYHIYNPVFQQALTASYVGNYASPYQNHDFFNRDASVDFFFLKTRDAYLLTPQNVTYYNTRTPYTMLDFTQSENRSRKNETRFNVLHSQNINPYWNFTFRWDQARSDGQYKNQDSKNNFLTLYSNYNKDKLNIYGGFISNRISNSENGGIHPDADLLGEPDTDFLDVNLTSVSSAFKNLYFYTTGEYMLGRFIKDKSADSAVVNEEGEVIPMPLKFKPFASVIYSFQFENHTKNYIDQEDTLNPFFQHAYYGPDYDKDSIRFGKISNVLQLKHYENPDRRASFGKRAFLGQEYVRLVSPGPIVDTYNLHTKRYSNIYAGGGIFRETGSFWRWNFDGRIYLLGRNVGQTQLSGVITKPFSLFGDSLASITVNGQIENMMPDPFQEEFYSNRIRWKNDFNMEQKMTMSGSIRLPGRHTLLKANYSLINNYIYNNAEGIPTQDNGQLLVLSAHADKNFVLGNLHFRTRLLWQKASNNDVLHLPDLSAFLSTNFRFVISKVLFTQIGADMRYYTSFYADMYNPSTGMFYIQNQVKTGDFPYLDVYANLRLKRTRVFFKLMNLGTEFINKEYYTIPGYPMNRRTFRMGVAWSFYD